MAHHWEGRETPQWSGPVFSRYASPSLATTPITPISPEQADAKAKRHAEMLALRAAFLDKVSPPRPATRSPGSEPEAADPGGTRLRGIGSAPTARGSEEPSDRETNEARDISWCQVTLWLPCLRPRRRRRSGCGSGGSGSGRSG